MPSTASPCRNPASRPSSGSGWARRRLRSAAALLALALALVSWSPLAAQRPTVSPRLTAGADTAVTVWLFARPSARLTDVHGLVATAGGTVRRSSRWLHAVSATLPPAALARARTSRLLRHLQPVERFRRGPRPAAPRPSFAAAAAIDSAYGPAAAALRVLGVFPLIERGFRGGGITIAILDTGFETELAPFAGALLLDQYDFVFNDTIVRNEPGDAADASEHGTMVWSLLAAEVPDSLIGLAPDAAYLLAKTEDVRSETALEEDNYVAALEWADSLGATIVTSSLTYRTFDGGGGYTFSQLNGDIAVTTVAADAAAARGLLVVSAVGNAGPGSRSLGTPADGDSVLAIGAVDTLGQLAGFSGRGPTADGRIKPDLLGPGVAIWVRGPAGFSRETGTSFATPLIAGLAALLREVHPTFGPVDIADALRAAGTNAAQPDTVRGWGVPDAMRAAVFPRGLVSGSEVPGVPEASPRLAWAAPDVPAFAQPVAFRVTAASDSALTAPDFDTTVSGTTLTLPLALRPGETIFVGVRATAADSTTLAAAPVARTGPPWIVLDTLNAPGGLTIRDLRPTFDWSAPFVAPAVGAFRFRVEVIREADGSVDLVVDSITMTELTPPRNLERNTPYRWRVTAYLAGDSSTVESAGPFVIVDDSAPPVTTLFQNFPNPFPNTAIGQTSTCIWFDLAAGGAVSLEILDIRGHILRRLLPGGPFGVFLSAGRYGRPSTIDGGRCDPQLEWDGTARDGSFVPAGVYLARLATPDGAFYRRIVFLGAP